MKQTILLILGLTVWVNSVSVGQDNQVVIPPPVDSTAIADSVAASLKESEKNKDEIKVAPWFVERLTVAAGIFAPVSNTVVKVSGNGPNGEIGTDIDLENDLGLDRRTETFMAGVQWRIKRRSRMELTYYRLNRNATYELKKDIICKDEVYPIDAQVNSFFNTDIFRLSYGFSILAKPKYEVGLMVGAHILGTSVGIGYANSTTSGGVSKDFDFTAPLPNFGIWGGYAFSKRWAVNGEFDYLTVTVGDYNGRILAVNLNVKYRIIKTLDIAAGYTGLNTRVKASKRLADGIFTWGYNGPAFAVLYSFGGKKWIHSD